MKKILILFFLFCLSGSIFAQSILQPLAMKPLPLGELKASGWLKSQLRIQADGLSGHLDEFWPDIKNSGWFGGEAEGWERAPYWLDGIIPLAYTLDDPALKAKAKKYINIIIKNQYEDGWLGPKTENLNNFDLWSLFLAMKMLTQYQDATGDLGVEEAIEKCLRRVDQHIYRSPLRNWAMFRWFEALIPIYWLYEKSNDPWLLDLAVKLRAQGFDYSTFYEHWPLTEPTPKGLWNFMGHVVNNAMALKAPALWWRLSNKEPDYTAVYNMIKKLDQYHGMVTGVFSGDECLAGKNPTQGTELCAVAEYMFSLEVLLSILGNPLFADRLEKIAFNALPATFSPDMWAHQYDQQVNQVECSIREDRLWNTNGPQSNIFGLEPNYGCCTSNFSQGWPKFAAHLWMKSKDGGLVSVVLAPSEVITEINNVAVNILCNTAYPFEETLRYRISASEPVRFPLYLRIPGWSVRSELEIDGDKQSSPMAGKFYKIDRLWEKETDIVVRLKMKPRASRRYNNAIAIERGPLVFALQMDEEWKQVNQELPHREAPHGDWEVYPRSSWNYALRVSEDNLEKDIKFSSKPVGELPFSPQGAPVSILVKAARVPEWKMVNGSAGELPVSPVITKEPIETITLIPYGCTNLRVTEFPTLGK